MRTYVFGDIHGGLLGLQQLLNRMDVQTEDQLIFLGDYVDGWSDSAATIDFLIDLQGQHKCIFILGNHDQWTYQWLKTGEADKVWLNHGGQLTMENYSIGHFDKDAHIDFFEAMKLYHVDPKNRLFVHAGFTSMHGPEKEHYDTNFYWDRTLWESALILKEVDPARLDSLETRFDLFHEIYIGHTPTIIHGSNTPINAFNLWNIDTGAGFTGKLSAMDIDSKEIWQSDPLPKLYPFERGRN